MAHVFVSYKHEDGDFADVLKHKLVDAGFDVWTDINLQAGEAWREGIDQAIKQSFALIVVMTPQAKESEYVTYEWACAWGVGVKVIPVLLEPTELHPRLEALQHLDFTSRRIRPWDNLIKRVQEIEDTYNPGTVHVSHDIPPVVRRAITALDKYDYEERENGVSMLAQMNHPAAREALFNALQHIILDVRLMAAVRLAFLTDYSDSRVLPPLLEGLRWGRVGRIDSNYIPVVLNKFDTQEAKDIIEKHLAKHPEDATLFKEKKK